MITLTLFSQLTISADQRAIRSTTPFYALLSLYLFLGVMSASAPLFGQTEALSEEKISLDFENTSLSSIVNYLAQKRDITIVPNKALEQVMVSFHTRHDIPLSEAWDTLYTLLDINGFTLIHTPVEKDEKLYSVISTKDSLSNPIATYSSAEGITPDQLPDTDEYIRYIYFCKDIKARVAAQTLEKLLQNPGRSVQINQALEVCILSEKSRHIKSAMEVIVELDKGGLREAIRVIELKNANAVTIAQLFSQSIFNAQQQNRQKIAKNGPSHDISYFSEDTKIIPEPNKNQLILMGTAENIDKVIFFIQKYLDIPLDGTQSRLHIKELKYFSAEDMKALIEKLITTQRGQGQAMVEGDYKYFEDVIIVNEVAHGQTGDGLGSGNRLIISCNPEDWIRLDRFIDRLDKPAPQIAMEILIIDLSTEDERALGTELRNLGSFISPQAQGVTAHLGGQGVFTPPHGSTTSFADGISVNNPLDNMQKEASTILTVGTQASGHIWGVLQAICNSKSSNIIAQPFLTANNNTVTKETISTTRMTPGAITTGGANGIQIRQMDKIPADTTTKILPRVNAAGIVDMQIDITINEFTTNAATSANTTTRSLLTRAMVAVGEVLIIGGLMSDASSRDKWHTPGLSSIPLLGNLFKNSARTDSQKHLYVFIRPSVITPMFDGTPDDYTQFKLDYAKLQTLKNDPLKESDPIQRWFFNPQKYAVKQRLADIAENRVPALDDFVEHRSTPKTVHISKDPYFKVLERRDTHTGDSQTHSTFVGAYNPEKHDLSFPKVTPDDDPVGRAIEESLFKLERNAYQSHLDKLDRRKVA